MSAEYPESIYDPRVLENKPGFEYDPDDTTVLFAEDFNGTSEEIRAIESTLGLLPAPFVMPSSGMLPYLYGIEQNKYKVKFALSYTIPGSLPGGGTIGVPTTPGSTPPEPFVQMTGGRVGVRIGVTTTFYGIIPYWQKLSNSLYQCFVIYRNETTGAMSQSISLPSGAVVSLDPHVYAIFDYNPNIFSI